MASGLYSHPSPPLRRARIEERGHELDCSLAPRGVGLRTTLHYRKWGEFFRVAYASRDIMASLLQAILSTPQVPVSTLGSREKLSVSTSTPQGQTLKVPPRPSKSRGVHLLCADVMSPGLTIRAWPMGVLGV